MLILVKENSSSSRSAKTIDKVKSIDFTTMSACQLHIKSKLTGSQLPVIYSLLTVLFFREQNFKTLQNG